MDHSQAYANAFFNLINKWNAFARAEDELIRVANEKDPRLWYRKVKGIVKNSNPSLIKRAAVKRALT